MSREFRLGLFVVLTLLILCAGVFLVGGRDRFFGTYRLRATFPNVAGLDPGAEVRVGGIHEGTVVGIDLPKRPDQPVTVVMDLDKATRNILKKDSVAIIRPEGLLGDKFVEISFGTENGQPLRNGDTVESETPVDFSDLIKKTDQILDATKTTVDEASATAGNVEAITSKINAGQGTVGALINSKSIYNQADASVAELREDMEALKHNFLLRGFFKQRGYEDSDELTKYAIAKLPSGPVQRTFDYNPKRLFSEPDSARLKDKKALRDAGNFLQSEPFALAVIVASAGMKGDSAEEKKITEGQAMVVRDDLVQNFRLDDTRIKTLGLGKTENTGDDGRLEIVVYPPSSEAQNQVEHQVQRNVKR